MSQADELLDSLTEDQVTTASIDPATEPHIVINADRTITVPEELMHIAVQGDHNIETVTFDCPRYWDGRDLSAMSMRIVFQRPDGHREPHPVENLRVDEADDTMIHFDWTVSGNVTEVMGNISFLVCAKLSDAEGVRQNEWHTRLNQDLIVDEGMECSGDEIVEQNPDIIESILVRLDNLESGTTTGGIPDYWEAHLSEKIATIKELQRAGGKDCYSFVVITDYHRYGNIGKRSPALIKKIMEECGIRFCLCLGDIQNGGAWKTRELDLAEWEEIENEFAPIRDRTLMIPGNHDGAYGSDDINGDGVVSGTTDYYIYNLTPDEVYDLIYRKVGLIPGVNFDESYNGYYVDDPVSKVRYILVNTHYSDGATNEDGTAVNNYMRKIRVGQPQMDMVISALQGVPAEDWHVVAGMHIPLAAISNSGPSGDMVLLRDILEAHHGKTAYTNTFGTEGEYDYVSVDADFAAAKGTVAGAFCGHVHTDGQNDDYAFPIITSMSDDTSTAKIDGAVVSGEAGTITEQSFDVFTVNKRTGAVYATKIGHGSDRVFGAAAEDSDTPVTAYTNLADPTSEDWYDSAYLISGTVMEDDGGVDQLVTNFIPVTQYDIVRWKGLDMETICVTGTGISLYDENKAYLNTLALYSAGTNSIVPVITTDDNGVTSYEILMRGSTGQQFVYGDYCTKTKYIRFSCCPLTSAEDIIITVNEEIV